MKREVTLVYDAGCPNVAEARAAIRQALERAGLVPRWREIERGAAGTAERFPEYGSPTILVDGVDVTGEREENSGPACRLYPTMDGLRGVPAVEAIVAAIWS